MASLDDFPSEVLHQITGHFEYRIDLFALSQTNRRFSLIANERLYNNLRQGQYSSRDDLFLWAVENGKEACVRRFLHAGIPLPSRILTRWEPIIIAADKGYAGIVRALLEHGVDPSFFHRILAPSLRTPLLAAVSRDHESVVKVLLEYHADLELGVGLTRGLEMKGIRQPLSMAVKKRHLSLVRLLLDHGCNPLTPNYDYDGSRKGCAWEVAAGTDLDILAMFINKGFWPDFSDPAYSHLVRYRGVLEEALKNRDVQLVKFLFAQAADLEPDAHGYNSKYCDLVLHAFKKGNISAVKFLSSLDDWDELEVLPDPCDDDDAFGQVDQDEILYRIGYASGKFPLDGEFLLQKVNVNKLIQEKSLRPIVCLTVGAAFGGNEELMKRLLDTKEPQIVQTGWKNHLSSCLTISAWLGHYGLVSLLLDYGADPQGAVKGQQTRSYGPTIYAAAEKGFADIVRLLLNRGADPFPRQQFTLLEKVLWQGQISETRKEIIQLLMERDILIPKGGDGGKSLVHAIKGGAEIFQLVLQHIGGKLQAGNCYHEEAFEGSVRITETTIMEMFLKEGFNPNAKTTWNDQTTRPTSFLALAAQATDVAGAGEQAVDLLLKYGANLNWRDPRTNHPPHYCLDKPEVVRLLLKKGADPLYSPRDSMFSDTTRFGVASTVKVMLRSFDEQDIPFEKVGPIVEEAINDKKRQGRNPMVTEFLRRWHCRRVYACQGKPYVVYM